MPFLKVHIYNIIFNSEIKSTGRAVRNSKKKFWPVTGLWNRGPLKILYGIKLILDDQGNHLES